MHVPITTAGEPPAGLGRPARSFVAHDVPQPSRPIHPPPTHRPPPVYQPPYELLMHRPRVGPRPAPAGVWPRYWWLAVLVSLPVLGALGLGTWVLLGLGGGAGGAAGGTRISAHGLTYQVPGNWASRSKAELPWVRDMVADGVGVGPSFRCGRGAHSRGTAGVLLVYRNDGRPPRASDAADAFGLAFARTSYGDNASLRGGGLLPWGRDGVTVRVTARTGPDGGCQVEGQVNVVALPSTELGPAGQPTVRVFMLQHDTSGGPNSPASLSSEAAQAIIASLQAN
jgi:hypothetical protein